MQAAAHQGQVRCGGEGRDPEDFSYLVVMRRPFWRLALLTVGLQTPGLLAGGIAASLTISVVLSGAAPGFPAAPPFSGAAA